MTETRRPSDVGPALSLLEGLGTPRGIGVLVSTLHREVGAPVAILDLNGSSLAQAPARAAWPVEEILRWRPDGPPVSAEVTIVPVAQGDEVLALLCTRAGAEWIDLVRVAARLAALEFGRRQALQLARRDLAGQLLEGVFTGTIPDWEARSRLGRLGIDLMRPNHVIVGRVECATERLRSFPWNLHTLLTELSEPYLRAVVGDALVLIVPTADEVPAIARQTLLHLQGLGQDARVGIGGAHRDVRGMRLGYYEAISSVESGPGINRRERVDLPSAVLAAIGGMPLGELARHTLAPLLEYDEQHAAGRLVETLRTYLEHNCEIGPAAEALFVHRNTLRYRLSLIEDATGRQMSSADDLVHFWLAVRLVADPA